MLHWRLDLPPKRLDSRRPDAIDDDVNNGVRRNLTEDHVGDLPRVELDDAQ